MSQKPFAPSPLTPGRIRLADVAAASGVSKSIASRVLNNYPGVSIRKDTRERILRAAEQLGYRANSAAQAVARSKTGAVALLTPSLDNSVYVRILRGCYRRALEREMVVLMFEDLDPDESAASVTSLIRSGGIDGLIMASAVPGHSLLPILAESALPHVFVNRAVPESGRNIVLLDSLASEMAAVHLIALGHRRIGSIAGPAMVDPARRRAEAFAAKAASEGIGDVQQVHEAFNYAGGAHGAATLLSQPQPPTAIYTHSVAQAFGALAELDDRGVRVPYEVSLIAYDDMDLANYTRPALTTIRAPLAELGVAAVDALCAQLEGSSPGDRVVDHLPALVVRNSTAPPRSEIL
jgi:DNA-binding LacI/PurR family transcriptional regulator